MKVSKLIHGGEDIDINLDVDIYTSESGEYEVFISQDGSSGVSYDIKTTNDIANHVKEYLETYCVKSSKNEEE